MKTAVCVFLAGVALSAGPAFAAPTSAVPGVANTSQKGSVLFFPQVSVALDSDTVIEISNDQNSAVNVECYYVNQEKGKDNFSFVISANGTVSWDVKTLAGDHVTPNAFPTGTPVPTPPGFAPENAGAGALICFATSPDGRNQIAFNHLWGTATVLRTDDTVARQPRLAAKYNAWSFKAWAAGGALPADGTIIGAGGNIQLVGYSATTSFFDACPAFNNATFMANGAALGNIRTLDNVLAGVSCNQDLRQDFIPRWTKLKFKVWNANEGDFTGSFICVDSVFGVQLGFNFAISAPAAAVFSNPQNFDFGTLATPNAKFTLQGIQSAQCPTLPTTAAGLLTVLNSEVTEPPFGGIDDLTATTLYGAGAETGFILWDPEPVVPPFLKKK